MHDIYDPPPAPTAWVPPQAGPLAFTAGDLIGLLVLGIPLVAVARLAGSIEPTLAVLVTLGGTLVILESWVTALGFLHRHPDSGQGHRWFIVLAALVPWLIGLGIAAALMLGLFLASDLLG